MSCWEGLEVVGWGVADLTGVVWNRLKVRKVGRKSLLGDASSSRGTLTSGSQVELVEVTQAAVDVTCTIRSVCLALNVLVTARLRVGVVMLASRRHREDGSQGNAVKRSWVFITGS